MNGWQGKKVLITGASSGIGLATVKHALTAGASISALYRSDNKALLALQSSSLHLFKGDVTQVSDVEQWVKAAEEQLGEFDVVINNAGAMYYMDITKPHYQQMKTMIETNCIGFINLMSAALPGLIAAPQGHWINITSDAGKRPFPGLAIYSGTKAFVEFSAGAMRQELIKAGVKVTNIQPGNVHTPLHQKSTEAEAVSTYGSENEGQYLSTTDIVEAITYALSTPFQVAVNEILIEPLQESI